MLSSSYRDVGVTGVQAGSLAATVALVVFYALGSGFLVSTGDAWYRRLEAPPWQPPDAAFGVIWPYNFAALIAAGVAVSLQGSSSARLVWVIGLAVSVVAALAWAWLFFERNALWPAAFALGLAALVTLPLVAVAWRTRTWAGVILLPYQVWLLLAASLSVAYSLPRVRTTSSSSRKASMR